MHFTTKETVSIDKEGVVKLPEHIFNEVKLNAVLLQPVVTSLQREIATKQSYVYLLAAATVFLFL